MHTEDALDQLAAARAYQTADAEDLAAATERLTPFTLLSRERCSLPQRSHRRSPHPAWGIHQ